MCGVVVLDDLGVALDGAGHARGEVIIQRPQLVVGAAGGSGVGRAGARYLGLRKVSWGLGAWVLLVDSQIARLRSGPAPTGSRGWMRPPQSSSSSTRLGYSVGHSRGREDTLKTPATSPTRVDVLRTPFLSYEHAHLYAPNLRLFALSACSMTRLSASRAPRPRLPRRRRPSRSPPSRSRPSRSRPRPPSRSPLRRSSTTTSTRCSAARRRGHRRRGLRRAQGGRGQARRRKLARVAGVDLNKLSEQEKYAAYLNAYNGYTLKLILNNYPGVKSIKKLEKPWDTASCGRR